MESIIRVGTSVLFKIIFYVLKTIKNCYFIIKIQTAFYRQRFDLIGTLKINLSRQLINITRRNKVNYKFCLIK